MATQTQDQTFLAGTPGGPDPAMVGVGNQDPKRPGAALIGQPVSLNLPGGQVTADPVTGNLTQGAPSDPAPQSILATDLTNTANSQASATAITDFLRQFQTQQAGLQQQILAASQQTEREQALQKQIDQLTSSAKAGIVGAEDKAIPMEFITGQQASIERRANVLLDPLQKELTREEGRRTGLLGRLQQALGFQADQGQLQLQALQEQRKPVLEAEKRVQDYIFTLATKYPDAGITLSDSAESAAKKVAQSKTYQAETAGKVDTQVVEVGGRKVLINSQTGETIKALGSSTAGGGDFGGVSFAGGITDPTTPAQTFEQFLAAEEEKAGLTFGEKKRAELRKQFAATQTATAPTDVKTQWLSNPQVDARIKDVIRGASKFTDYTQAERKRLQTQYDQASNAGVVPQATTAAQEAKFSKLTDKYDRNPIVRMADKASGLNSIADQVIANPRSATNQLKALYSLVKQLDPDSAVREGELSLAQETLSTFEKYGQKITKLKTGQILPSKQATAFANAIKELSTSWNSALSHVNTRYASEARVDGIESMWTSYVGGFEQPQNQSTAPQNGKTSSGNGFTVRTK